jgi:hypothetical protein
VEAADHPECLDHVSREDVLLHAADVLVRAGDYEQARDLAAGHPRSAGMGGYVLER